VKTGLVADVLSPEGIDMKIQPTDPISRILSKGSKSEVQK